MRWTMMIWVAIHIFSSSVRLHLHSSNQYIEVVEKRKISLAWTGSHLMSKPAKSLVLDCLFRGSIRLMRHAEEGGHHESDSGLSRRNYRAGALGGGAGAGIEVRTAGQAVGGSAQKVSGIK